MSYQTFPDTTIPDDLTVSRSVCGGRACFGAAIAATLVVSITINSVGLFVADRAGPCITEHGWLQLWLHVTCGVSLAYALFMGAVLCSIMAVTGYLPITQVYGCKCGWMCLYGIALAIFRTTMAVLGTIELAHAWNACLQGDDHLTLVVAAIVVTLQCASIASACVGL